MAQEPDPDTVPVRMSGQRGAPRSRQPACQIGQGLRVPDLLDRDHVRGQGVDPVSQVGEHLLVDVLGTGAILATWAEEVFQVPRRNTGISGLLQRDVADGSHAAAAR